MSLPDNPLMQSVFNKLNSNLSETVYKAGGVPTDAGSKYVVVELPRGDGEGFLTGGERYSRRIPIRIHTRYPPGLADRSEALTIADSIDEALNPRIDVSGKDVYVPPANVRPRRPYDVGNTRAYDVALRYDFSI